MKTASLYLVELKRLALSKYAWGATILSLCTPLIGYWAPLSNPDVMTGQFIANPVLTGTIAGAIIWALLTLIELNRVHRAGAGMLIDAIASPLNMAWVRLAALITFSAVVWLVCLLIYLPYTVVNLGFLFSTNLYLLSFAVLMLPTWWISILLAAALIQIARRILLAGLLYAVLVAVSFGMPQGDFFSRWINPIVLTFSDGFSSLYFLRIAFYTRVIWLAIAGGFWIFSLLCIRRYQKGLIGSFWQGLRKAYLPVAAALLIAAGSFLWINQPFVDHGPAEFYFGFHHVTEIGIIEETTLRLTPNPATGRLHGVVEYEIRSGRGNSVLSLWHNPGYRILSIESDGVPVDFRTTSEFERDAVRTEFILEERGRQTLIIEYEGFPTMLRAFAPHNWGNEINRNNITLNNSAAMPRIDELTPTNAFNLELTLPGNMIPVINHRLITDYEYLGNGSTLWTARIRDRSLRINAGDYIVESFVAAGMDVDFIFTRAYEQIMYEFEIPNAIAEVLGFFTERLGPLHWAHLPSLSMLQSSALMFGGIAGDGFVEWGESIFTVSSLDNPLQGTNAMEVFVHEMVHMWWGGLGVMSGWGNNGELWSDEGLTVYYTYRFFLEKYGEGHAQQIVDSWQRAVDIQDRCFYSRNPEYLDKLPEMYRAVINTRNRVTNLYARMPLMILRAEEMIGGPEIMDEKMRQVQQVFAGRGWENLFTFQDFLDAVGLTEEDITL